MSNQRLILRTAALLVYVVACDGCLYAAPAFPETSISCLLIPGKQRIVEGGNKKCMLTIPVKVDDLRLEVDKSGNACFGSLPLHRRPGYPKLPIQQLTVLLPPDAKSDTVKVTFKAIVTRNVPGSWKVAPSPPPVGPDGPFWEPGHTVVDGCDTNVYSADANFPGTHFGSFSAGKRRKWKLAKIRVYPFLYNPVQGSLSKMRSFRLCISYEKDIAELEAIKRFPPAQSPQSHRLRLERRRRLKEKTANFADLVRLYDELE